MDVKKDNAGQTLRRPVTVVKKRSGPLDSMLDELNRIEESANAPESVAATVPVPVPVPVPKSSSSVRRRTGHSKDKDKDKDRKRERWLLTRKTWRYMTDAGRKLFPDNGSDSISHIEAQFQRVCASEPRFILWRRKSSFPGANKSNTRKRLKILSRHRHNYGQQRGEADKDQDIDQTIEMLQAFLKIRDAYKTTFLLGSKTIRPDQTSSPSSRRPKGVLSGKQGSIDLDSESVSEPELLARLQALQKKNSLAGVELQDITPDLLHDKVLLKKLYNVLKKQQLHRILHSTEPRKTQLERASSFSSCYADFGSLKDYESEQSKRQRKPPATLELAAAKCVPNSLIDHKQKTREREKSFNSIGTQTKFIPLSELKLIAQQYEALLEHHNNNNGSASCEDESREEKQSVNRRKSSIDNEDVSQSVSDTIKRYLRMARKKSVHDGDANRFKSLNYDRNLRNIKAKGEINPPGLDELNHKAIQTLDAWARIALDFIRGLENSGNLQNAHVAWQKDLDERIAKKLEYDRQYEQTSNSQSPSQTQSPSHCISAPTSPTSTVQSHLREKTGRTASALLSSSSHFISNFWHANNAESAGFQNSKHGHLNDAYLSSKNETNMQKSKSLSNVGQFVSRKIWGSRSKAHNARQNDSQNFAAQPQKWAPSENCTWISEQGDVLQLTDTSLEKLCDTEAELLMHIAIAKIKELNIGLSIDLQTKPTKRKVISKKRALTTSFFDIGRKDEHNKRDVLFGTSLENCLTRDKKQNGNGNGDGVDSGSKHSLTSVFRGSNCNNSSNSRTGKLSENVRSCESLPTKSLDYIGRGSSERSNLQKSSSISMQMSRSQFDMRSIDMDLDRLIYDESKQRFQWNVPVFVINCIEYLEEHGLQKVGIFRVSTSRKRVKQLRDDFDKKWDMCIPDNTCPHDVATLLKEYLRDLPEPLLCQKFYSTFVETQRIRNRRLQLEAISHLIKLLPVAHRDTLHVLLRFLGNVAAHCDDICSSDGTVQMNGNKMDSYNLSTVFAPNILRNSDPKTAESAEQGNIADAINVIRIMIDHYEELFRVPGELIDVLYSHMLDTCPEKLHAIISSKINQLQSSQIAEKPKHKSENDSENDSREYVKDTALQTDARRQSTPILLDKLNVFSASLQIAIPDDTNTNSVDLKENKMLSSIRTEPKPPASISNIGGATLSAKTAEFERSAKNNSTSRSKQLYKRQQLISSSKR